MHDACSSFGQSSASHIRSKPVVCCRVRSSCTTKCRTVTVVRTKIDFITFITLYITWAIIDTCINVWSMAVTLPPVRGAFWATLFHDTNITDFLAFTPKCTMHEIKICENSSHVVSVDVESVSGKTACSSPVSRLVLQVGHLIQAHSVVGPIWRILVRWSIFVHSTESEWFPFFVCSCEGHNEGPNRSRFRLHITIHCARFLLPIKDGVIARCFTTMVEMVKTTFVWGRFVCLEGRLEHQEFLCIVEMI
jgi:hypothetical protein